jgi:lysophospholipid acyltransferase (LPLAT)-like uncharacterized protein
MILPYPFSRGIFIFGEPIYVNPDSSLEQMEEKRRQLEQALNQITIKADGHFGRK